MPPAFKTLFGGKAPHQHSFLYGGVAEAPTADKISSAQALIKNIQQFIKTRMVPDTELIAKVYNDYFEIGKTTENFLSFGLFRFGIRNEEVLSKSGALRKNTLEKLNISLINEEVPHSWFEKDYELHPSPYKENGYSYVKTVKYEGDFFQVGPLAPMIITGQYSGGTSTMDRIYARTLESLLIAELIEKWLKKLQPGPPPISQKKEIVNRKVTAVTDAMRGTLLHNAEVANEEVLKYNIITPTVWNFSPKDSKGRRGPVENALVGTIIENSDEIYTVLGRIIRSFDPCLNCGTHVLTKKEDRKRNN